MINMHLILLGLTRREEKKLMNATITLFDTTFHSPSLAIIRKSTPLISSSYKWKQESKLKISALLPPYFHINIITSMLP